LARQCLCNCNVTFCDCTNSRFSMEDKFIIASEFTCTLRSNFWTKVNWCSKEWATSLFLISNSFKFRVNHVTLTTSLHQTKSARLRQRCSSAYLPGVTPAENTLTCFPKVLQRLIASTLIRGFNLPLAKFNSDQILFRTSMPNSPSAWVGSSHTRNLCVNRFPPSWNETCCWPWMFRDSPVTPYGLWCGPYVLLRYAWLEYRDILARINNQPFRFSIYLNWDCGRAALKQNRDCVPRDIFIREEVERVGITLTSHWFPDSGFLSLEKRGLFERPLGFSYPGEFWVLTPLDLVVHTLA
jgi:hypothetical protein